MCRGTPIAASCCRIAATAEFMAAQTSASLSPPKLDSGSFVTPNHTCGCWPTAATTCFQRALVADVGQSKSLVPLWCQGSGVSTKSTAARGGARPASEASPRAAPPHHAALLVQALSSTCMCLYLEPI